MIEDWLTSIDLSFAAIFTANMANAANTAIGSDGKVLPKDETKGGAEEETTELTLPEEEGIAE